MATFKLDIVVTVILILVVTYTRSGISLTCQDSIAVNPPETCPTWYVKTESQCECGGSLTTELFVQCLMGTNKTTVSKGYCVTYDNASNETFAGKCAYNAGKSATHYIELPSDLLQLNEQMCGLLNRTGLLCSQCKPGLGPAFFSYYRECKECVAQPFGWILLFVRLTVPLTLFCLIVIIFQLNIASPALNGFVLVVQLISNEYNNNPFMYSGRERYYSLIKISLDCYGLFNLDFFNYMIPSFCISEDISMLSVLALEYIVALYPIIITVVIYYCITLHDRGCRVVVICWKPFHKCFTRLRRSWQPKGSVVNAFATFILLSYCKFCSTSLNLVQIVQVWDICGISTNRVYYDASYKAYSKHFIPYLVIASIIIFFFIILPAFYILLYQNRYFQKCLSACKIRCVLIHELANVTQGCFKNGTSPGTRDYRWFAGFYLILRILLVFITNLVYNDLLFVIISTTMVLLVATLRPYRVNWCNTLDSVFWLVLAIGMSWHLYWNAFSDISTARSVHLCLKGIPLLYIVCYMCYTAYKKWLSWILKRKRACTNSFERNAQENGELPDRLLHPNEYTPLIQKVYIKP